MFFVFPSLVLGRECSESVAAVRLENLGRSGGLAGPAVPGARERRGGTGRMTLSPEACRKADWAGPLCRRFWALSSGRVDWHKTWVFRWERKGHERLLASVRPHTFSLDEARERARQARQQLRTASTRLQEGERTATANGLRLSAGEAFKFFYRGILRRSPRHVQARSTIPKHWESTLTELRPSAVSAPRRRLHH